MLLGMNQHSLHPEESLSSQKLTSSEVSIESPILAFLNTLNTNNVMGLFALKTGFENVRLFNILLPGLLNRSYEVLSSLALSASITFEMGTRRKKIEQVSSYLREPLNSIKAKFFIPVLRTVNSPNKIWQVMNLSLVIKDWKAKNLLPFLVYIPLIFPSRGIAASPYYLLSISHPELVTLGWSNIKDKTAFYQKFALLAKNLRLLRLLTIFNQEDKVQTLLSFLRDRDCKFICEKVVFN